LSVFGIEKKICMSFFEELKRRNVVRVAILYAVASWLTIQIGDVLFDTFDLPSSWLRLVVAVLILCFPIALILSWVYEMTPEGIKRERDVDRTQSVTHQTGHKINTLIVVLLVLTIAVVVGDRLVPENAPVADTPIVETQKDTQTLTEVTTTQHSPEVAGSIAVLPFASRSTREEDIHFVDGIHDDILTQLSKLSAFEKVISRTSTEQYRGTTKTMIQIGQELGVANILEGGVQRAGNRVRINMQLIETGTDKHLWAETYDRELTAENIFRIQSEITEAIATALNAVLSTSDEDALHKRPTQSLAAYDAYLTGRLLSKRYYEGEERIKQAVAAFDEAIALDTAFAEAYAEKAYALLNLYWFTPAEGPWREAADESLRKAEALAPDAIEPLSVRGYYHYWGHLDYESAEASFAQALDIAPNYVNALNGRGYNARRAGDFEKALRQLEEAHRVDPLNLDTVSTLAQTYTQLGHFQEAQILLRRAETAGAGGLVDPATYSDIWDNQGDTERAWQAIMRPVETLTPVNMSARVAMAIKTRDPANIRATIESWPEAVRRPDESPEAYDISRARALLALGEDQAARALLSEIKARIDAASEPYPQGWKANALYYPVTLPGLMGDLDGVRAAIADYEAIAKPDAWREYDILQQFATALVLAGDSDTAFTYINRMTDSFGPWVYLPLSTDVRLDSIRDDPGYLRLKSDYEAWAAETER
jgi:TolB-like protein